VRASTVVISLVLHAALALGALNVKARARESKATKVSIVETEKKKPEPEKKPEEPKKAEEPPKPKIKPKAKEPVEAAPAVTEAPAKKTVFETGLVLDGASVPGIEIDVPAAEKVEEQVARPEPEQAPVVKKKALVERAAPIAEVCDEPPSKPVPVDRPTDIEYTVEARSEGIEGRLVLKITVAADGSVRDVEVVQSAHPMLDASAVAAVKTWRFEPAKQCGKAIEGVFTLARRFELGD
jgi:protein TonB